MNQKTLLLFGCLAAVLGSGVVLWIWQTNWRETSHRAISIGSPTLPDLIDAATSRIRRDASDWEAYVHRARYQSLMGHTDAARADLLRVVDSAPPALRVIALKQLGIIDLNLKQYRPADAWFSQAIEMAGGLEKDSEVLKELALLHEYRAAARLYGQEYLLSLDDCEAGLRHGGDACKLYQLRAMNHLKLRQWKLALDSVGQSRCAEDVAMIMINALALERLGREGEAQKHRLRAYEVNRRQAESWERFLDD